MEYSTFAKYYDIFYSKKYYKKEVEFLENLLKDRKSILDVGCGTGVHMLLLEQKGYNVDGVDLSKEMLDIASKKVRGKLYHQNILQLDINKKYDAIISMFAVVNHLDNLEQLKTVLTNFKKNLKDDGIIIIDLHNPQSSGSKEDQIDNMKRIMSWDYDKNSRVENSKIIFQIDGYENESYHKFKIFTIDELTEACASSNLKLISIYENYTNEKATEKSKNIQLYISNI